jgi:hypothetical protein
MLFPREDHEKKSPDVVPEETRTGVTTMLRNRLGKCMMNETATTNLLSTRVMIASTTTMGVEVAAHMDAPHDRILLI